MRMFVMKTGQDVGVLTERLRAGGGTEALSRLKALNPHLDLARLEPGSVLLVPDEVEGSESVAGAAFEALAKDARGGLKLAARRVGESVARADEQRKAVAAAMKTATFRSVLAGDAELARQATAAAEHASKAQRTQAKAATDGLDALGSLLERELDKLGKLMR